MENIKDTQYSGTVLGIFFEDSYESDLWYIYCAILYIKLSQAYIKSAINLTGNGGGKNNKEESG